MSFLCSRYSFYLEILFSFVKEVENREKKHEKDKWRGWVKLYQHIEFAASNSWVRPEYCLWTFFGVFHLRFAFWYSKLVVHELNMIFYSLLLQPEQLNKIFELCGTPDELTWPGVSKIPWYNKFKPTRPMKKRIRELFRQLRFEAKC